MLKVFFESMVILIIKDIYVFKKYKKLSFLVLFFVGHLTGVFVNSLKGTIKEVKTLQEVFLHIPLSKKTMIVCDLDNTLIMPEYECGLGSDAWFSFHAKRISQELNIDILKVYQSILPLYYDINLAKQYNIKPIEADTVVLFHEMQRVADRVIGLTARSYPLVTKTVQLLKNASIDFTLTEIITDKNIEHQEGCYFSGIGFCGWEKKSVVLDFILKETGYVCDVIIMIDDKINYLYDVEQMLKVHYPDIEFIGLHYTYLKDHVAAYKPLYLQHR